MLVSHHKQSFRKYIRSHLSKVQDSVFKNDFILPQIFYYIQINVYIIVTGIQFHREYFQYLRTCIVVIFYIYKIP